MTYGLLSLNGVNGLAALSPLLICLFVILAIWDGVWKLLGMWKAAKNRSVAWFICIFIFNTIGILPILYIYVFSRNTSKSRKRSRR